MTSIVDSHCHLQLAHFERRHVEVWREARLAGVVTCLVPGIDVPTSRSALVVAEELGIWCSAGTHPCHAADHDVAGLDPLWSHPRVVAVGECGFDFFHRPFDAALQEDVFRDQIRAAFRHRLPLVIHNRESDKDTVRVLRDEGSPGGVFHCFGGGRRCLEEALELGFFVSFAGNVTYPRTPLRDLVPLVPSDRLLIETDAPWLAPVPHRGSHNSPAFVARILEEVAMLRQVDPPALAAEVINNFRRCFPRTTGS